MFPPRMLLKHEVLKLLLPPERYMSLYKLSINNIHYTIIFKAIVFTECVVNFFRDIN